MALNFDGPEGDEGKDGQTPLDPPTSALVVGTINGCLIRFANFTPIAATLAMYIGLQGLSFVLRDGPGGYINFASADDQPRVADNYGANYPRLLQTKRRYDPDNVFHLNQNISP